MTDREKLIELLHKAEDICDSTLDCDTCKYVLSGSCKTVLIANYLLANGVILPPCKVGDTVYSLMGGFAEEMKVNRLMLILKPNNEYPLDFIREFDDFGKTVFLTKEEAEAELKKRGKENA